jgi:hypothetical protein
LQRAERSCSLETESGTELVRSRENAVQVQSTHSGPGRTGFGRNVARGTLHLIAVRARDPRLAVKRDGAGWQIQRPAGREHHERYFWRFSTTPSLR